jgi:hypothetical protein
MRDPRLGLRRQGLEFISRHCSRARLAMRAERRLIDKIVDGLKFHG